MEARIPALFILTIFVLIFSVGEVVSQTFDFFQPVEPTRSIQVIAHRGLKSAAPENTVPAFELCIKNYFEWIEVDVRLTKDKQHVIIHNKELDNTTDGAGLISEHTLEEIKQLDAGSWFAPRFAGVKVPTLKETLELCKGKINIYLDCKEVDPILLVKEIRDAGMENQVLVYDAPETLKIVSRESNGTIATMPNYRNNPDVSAWIGDNHPIALEIKYESVTPEIIKTLNNEGIITQVQCLGASDKPEVWRELMDMRVNWIQTDYSEGVIAEYTWKIAGDNRPVWITAHRGALGFAPENTIAAFKKAIDLGLDFIEIDVRTTKDGKMVLVHDSDLKRTAGLDMPVNEVEFVEIKELSAGGWFGIPYEEEKVPSLDEVFRLGKGKIRFYVDFKDGKPSDLVEAMRKNGVLDDCVIYGGTEKLAVIKAIEPKAKVMPGLGDPSQIEPLIKMCHPYAFDTKWRILSEELIPIPFYYCA
jgi:glycerophosphoryl diester phosphodiesterase